MSSRLQVFVTAVEKAIARCSNEPELLERVQAAMRRLVEFDDWLPAELSQPHPQYYQQYLLHADPAGRFSVVSFVWGPKQQTPIHDHTVWGVIGMLRGSELAQSYHRTSDGMVEAEPARRLQPGDVSAVSPTIGDIHRVSNACDDQVSISIHVYGTDIGRQKRHVFDAETGQSKDFISGYATTERR